MEVKIIDTAYSGYGVAKDDKGKVIFIPYSVEGDILDITVIKESSRFSYASVNKIIEASPYRITPKCRYAGICGGCLFNHIDYNKQLYIKHNIAANAVRNIDYKSGIKIIYNKNYNYRLRVNMAAFKGKSGFFKFKTNDFISIDECIILKESLFKKIKDFVYENNLTGNVYAIENNNSNAFAFVQSDKKINIKSFYKYFDGISIKHNKTVKRYGDLYMFYKTKHGDIGIGHKTFFQGNLYLLNEFQDEAVKYLTHSDNTVIELYSGSGFFTAAVENKIKSFGKDYKFISSEINRDSVFAANKYGFNIINEDALTTLKNIYYDIDVLILDPPREGIDKKIVKEIIRIKPEKIIYISCDPMTFARDINLLKDYYKLLDLNIIDMFADTYHIEFISYLEYKNQKNIILIY
ncbi:class I SAM-dependent RNA methyltransferase [uncultured Brachyspira sp.]|uniref:class I SAM-dependent RNA methyltransferase n=1 Tax=uncultured Brachyspira sp. TaxID=221953 RepID=UPI0025DDBBED|nr:TRAM domain-containing protein [uncultured Brachyspira sp.]